MKHTKSIFLLFAFMLAVVLWQGCDALTDPPLVGTTSSDVDFYAKDEMGNLLPGDTLYTGMPTIFVGRITGSFQVDHWEFQWADGSANSAGTGTSIMGSHKYLIANTYVTITLNVWDTEGILHSVTRTFWVQLGTNPTIPPILKLGSNSVQIDINTWDYDFWFLKEAIDSTCNPSGTPYYLDSTDGWVPRTMSVASDNRYYKITRRVINNQVLGIQYRRDNSCWASIAPRAGKWTSIYYDANGDKLYPKCYGGQLYLRNQIISSGYPGIVGDTVVRFDASANGDTIHVFFNKHFANGSSSPYWLSNIYGMGVQKTIYNTPGFASWWHTAFHRNQLPANTILTFRYGTSSGLANMSTSEYWDAVNQWLAAEISSIGGDNLKVKPYRR